MANSLISPKIRRFLAKHRPPTPCLVVDLDVVANNFRRIRRALPRAEVRYAVKANPAREVLETLVGLGSQFDAASAYEIDACLAAGALPEHVAYGNTIKKTRDIERAYRQGVRLFAFDSAAELDKLAAAAPGCRVYCRILTSSAGAQWPLSRKFGCELDMARDLMLRARERGLDACGLSFHVGSQQADADQWDIAIGRVAEGFRDLHAAGLDLRLVNLGGGFPVRYRDEVPTLEDIAAAIMASMARHFGETLPAMMVEPGRSVSANAGVLETEVVLIATKDYANGRRWVFLDVGKFGGLAETMSEAIRYQIVTPRDESRQGPVVIAGPTCDGADILYEEAEYSLPLDLEVGDRVFLLKAGAYTTTYASVGFNGFPPLEAYYI